MRSKRIGKKREVRDRELEGRNLRLNNLHQSVRRDLVLSNRRRLKGRRGRQKSREWRDGTSVHLIQAQLG